MTMRWTVHDDPMKWSVMHGEDWSAIQLPNGQWLRMANSTLADTLIASFEDPRPRELRMLTLRRLAGEERWAEALELGANLGFDTARFR